jgi:hypothetical protein
MSYTYKLNSEKFMEIAQRNIFVQELIDDKLDSTWSVEEICERWRWPWDERKGRESFVRCKKWLQENHPEFFI